MKALLYLGPRQLEWADVPSAEIADPLDVIVRPLAVATCDLDWEIVAGRTPFPAPFPLGHEFVGEVLQVGPKVTQFAAGDRVAVAFQPSCGHCPHCASGISSACKSVPPTSMFGVGAVSGGWGGAFAERIRVPFADHMLILLPPDADLTPFASASDNIADALRTVNGYVTAVESRVLILGSYDSIPLYAIACAQALGARHITYCTKDPRAADNARRLGATVELVEQWPKRFAAHDVTVCAVENPKALLAAIRSTKAGGHCTSVSIFAEDVTLPLREMYMRGIHFHTGRVESARVLGTAVKWIASGRIRPLDIDTAVVGFDALIPALLQRSAAKLVATQPGVLNATPG